MREGIAARRGKIAAAAAAAAGIASLALPLAAQALTVSGTTTPTNLQAGANSDVTININFGPANEDVENLTVGLPPGLTGNPQATPKCTLAQLNSATPGNDGCPANTQVGEVTANATITAIVLPITLDVSGKLYNLTPQPGEPARFGIVLQPGNLGGMIPGITLPLDPVILQSGTALRSSDFGLDTIINGIPNETPTPLGDLPTHINSQAITLFGIAPGTGNAFLRNPTSCTPKVTTFTATPHPPATGTATASSPAFTPTGCGSLPFSPVFSARMGAPGATGPTTKPPVTTVIEQDATEAGLKKAEVFLPSVVGSDSGPLTNPCPEAQFQAGTCPARNVVGTAVAASPFLSAPLTGPVIVVEAAGLPDVGLDLRGELPLKLKGTFAFGATTGVVFDNLPDIPISNFALMFSANGLVVSNVDLCTASPTFATTFTAHSGAVQTGTTSATVDGCGATPKKSAAGKCKAKKKKRKKGAKAAAKPKKKKKKAKCKRKKRKKKKGK